MKRTPLFAAHQRLGGKLIEFGGWEMPVQYSSITDEHLAVRQAAGLFDISHMGEVSINGPQAETFLNQVLTNDLRKLAPGHGQYTLMCNPQGGVIDDLYAYRLGPDEYLLIINASRISDDLAWLRQQLSRFGPNAGVRLRDASDATGALAAQGPRVAAFINACFPGPFTAGAPVALPTDLKKNQAARTEFAGRQVWVSRTGYTGEDGFEIVAPAEVIEALWNRLLKFGPAARAETRGPGRARHPAHGGLLPALRPRIGREHYSHRSRAWASLWPWARANSLAGRCWPSKKSKASPATWWPSS